MAKTYATFWKCALQVNTYSYSATYQGGSHGLSEDRYNEGIEKRCLANGIGVVGIADHGSVDGLDKLRKTLEAAGIVVLPGFEIASTEKVHMVCLYPQGTDVGSLNQNLGAMDIPSGGPKTAPSSLACLEIAKRVEKQGGFWFAAHVVGASGLLRLSKDGGGLTHIWCSCDHVLAAQIPAGVETLDDKIQQILRNKNAEYQRARPIALLNAKDVRQPTDLDNPRCFSWIKMTSPTLDALRLACRDAESRVRLSHQVNPSFYSRIERLVVRRGYLNELDIELSANLNAIVGGRGTGKSTLIEAIRYALQLQPSGVDAQRAHKGIIDANFAKERASIELSVTSFTQNSESYTITRQHGEPARVLDANGAVLKLTPHDILPRAEVYGQNELLAIVQDDEAKAKLLARFLPDDEAARGKLVKIKTDLRKNCIEIDALEERIADTTQKLELLPALIDKEKSFQKLGLEKELAQVQTRETERAFVNSTAECVSALEEAIEQFEAAIDEVEVPVIQVEAESPHAALLKALGDAVQAAKKAANDAAKNAASGTSKAKGHFAEVKAKLDAMFIAEEQLFHEALDGLPSMKGKTTAQLAADYKRVSSDIAKLKPLGAQKSGHEARLIGLTTDRATLLDQLSKTRSERWSTLTKAVKDLNKRLEGLLRVEFEPARIRDPLKTFFVACQMEGIGDKRLAWIDTAESISIADLVATIRQGSNALQARFREAGIGKQAADAIAALSRSRVRELEEMELPERLELLLNVIRNGESYREVGRLSTGQQCTAVLHLLLLDNPDPLIIDQPEDNLDNAFIADHIVGELRSGKTERQFLFATHNANIPVFGDAEWIGVLCEEEGHSKLQASGSIDAPAVKELAANILEGGKEAFNRRREKYGL